MTRTIIYTLLAFAFVSGTLATAAPPEEEKEKAWWWRVSGVDPAVPFEAEKMSQLVDSATGGAGKPHSLVRAIMQVTAQKDARFRGLIDRKDLRKERNVNLALCAYDYAINDNEKALARLIDLDAEQELGGDYMTIAIMGMIDEWDRTIESVWRHKAHSDGTAGTTAGMFFDCKRELFPESFARFRDSIGTQRKLIERLASTVADDPNLNHDHGTCYRFYEVSEKVHRIYRPKTGFCVKELPREGAEPLIFLSIGPGEILSTKPKRNWILAPVTLEDGGQRVWKDVTDDVLPGVEFQSMWLYPRRNDNVIETAPIVFVDEDNAHFGSRGSDLVWEGGKFLVRNQDGENFTGRSRAPYKPSR